jgi:hypothetical protein
VVDFDFISGIKYIKYMGYGILAHGPRDKDVQPVKKLSKKKTWITIKIT